MNCREVGTRLQALADDQIGPAHRREVEEHLSGCEKCAEAAREARQNVSFLVERLAHLRGTVAVDLSALQAPAAPAAGRTATATDTETRSRLPLVIIAVVVLIALAAAAYFLLKDGKAGAEEPTHQGRVDPVGPPERAKPKRASDRATKAAKSEFPPIARPDVAAAERQPGLPRKIGAPAPLGIAALLPIFTNQPTQPNLERSWKALAANPGYTPRLIARIEDAEDAATRALLVLILGADNREEDTRTALFNLIAADGSPRVRIAAGAALAWSADGEQRIPTIRGLTVPIGPIENETALKNLLIAAEAERDPAVVATLIRAVAPSEGTKGEISSRLAELARSESEVVRDAALAALRASPPADTRLLLRLISDTSLPVSSRAELVGGLSGSREAVTHLSTLIRGAEEVSIQVAAVGALRDCWDKYARIELLETLRSSNTPEVRRAAVGVISTQPSEGSLEVLKRVAAGDDDPGTRQAAEQAAKEMERALTPAEE